MVTLFVGVIFLLLSSALAKLCLTLRPEIAYLPNASLMCRGLELFVHQNVVLGQARLVGMRVVCPRKSVVSKQT